MPRDPRERRHRAPEVDHLAAAVRLEASLQAMRDRPDDEPPTGLIDLNAIRALLGQPVTADPDPAAAAWLAGGADPAAARMVERINRITEPAPVADVAFGELYEPEPAPVAEPRVMDVCPENVPGCTVQHWWNPNDSTITPLHPEVVEGSVDVVHAVAADLLARAGHQVEVVAEAEVAPSPEPVPPGPSPAVFPPPPAEPAPISDHTGPEVRWRSRHDERSRAYGVRRRMAGSAPLADRLWPIGPVLDQGSEGACVGFGIIDALNARAAGDRDLTAADALALFHRADQLDGDGLTGQGTSVLAGMQAGVEMGLFASYDWCFGTRDIAQTLLQRSPVVLGLPWLPGMAEPGRGGLMTLEGEDTGVGHCLAAVGLLLRGPQSQLGPFMVLLNSYDDQWGDGGLGYIHHRNLATLLRGVGEAAVPNVVPS